MSGKRRVVAGGLAVALALIIAIVALDLFPSTSVSVTSSNGRGSDVKAAPSPAQHDATPGNPTGGSSARVPPPSSLQQDTNDVSMVPPVHPDDPSAMLRRPGGRRDFTRPHWRPATVGKKPSDDGDRPSSGNAGPDSPALAAVVAKRLESARKLCTFVLAPEHMSSSQAEVVSAPMRAWGDHRTFITTFDAGLIDLATATHKQLADVLASNASLATDPDRWVKAAVEAATARGEPAPTASAVPPTLLLVPPPVPPLPSTALEGIVVDDNAGKPSSDEQQQPVVDPRVGMMEQAHAVHKAMVAHDARETAGKPWTLRQPEDVVVAFDPEHPHVAEMARVFQMSHPGYPGGVSKWLSKEGKSVLMWDYITRMLHSGTRADGGPGPGGFRNCHWVMKADTDTFVNRAALREQELVGYDPLTQKLYNGMLMMFAGPGQDRPGTRFQFGGAGYYISRALLEEIHRHPWASFRSAAHVARLRDFDVAIQIEDGLMGAFLSGVSDRLGIKVDMPMMFSRMSIGNGTAMREHVLRKRHRCVCCYRSLHKVLPESQYFLGRIVAENCVDPVPAAAYRQELAAMRTPLLTGCFTGGDNGHPQCKWGAYGGDVDLNDEILGLEGWPHFPEVAGGETAGIEFPV